MSEAHVCTLYTFVTQIARVASIHRLHVWSQSRTSVYINFVQLAARTVALSCNNEHIYIQLDGLQLLIGIGLRTVN